MRLQKNNSWLLVTVVAITLTVISSCATYTAVTTAPVEFWETLGSIVEAMLADLGRLVALFI